MLNVMRIMITVILGITALNVVLSGIQGEDILEPVRSFGKSILEALVFCCGIIAFTVRLALHMNSGTNAGKRYTRIMLPSFVFIGMADMFFTIISIFRGGFFRGWFSRFKPDAECDIIAKRK